MKKTIASFLITIATLFSFSSQLKTQNMKNPNKESQCFIFPQGNELSSNNFSGKVWLEMLVDNDTIFNCPIGNVTFEPGCRNSWHKHPGGQILLAIDGEGYYQEKGKSMQLVRPGDVIRIAPNVEHWHGATPHRSFTHLAITTNPQLGEVVWLQPVTDELYNQYRLY